MEVRAISKSVRISPRKIRLVADAIRHLTIDEAMQLLYVTPKRAAQPLIKTLQSAVANATNNAKLDKSNLIIGTILVNEGTVLKRFRPSTRGRTHPYKKRGTNITIIVKEKIVAMAATPLKEAKAKVEEPSKKAEKRSTSAKVTVDKEGGKK
jgi:large subunit ribosomal protein L22